MEDCRGISFLDNISGVVEGTDLKDVIAKLEGCARASLEWAEDNAVRFETSKTKAILFSRSQKYRWCHWQWEIKVGSQRVRFATDATWWLGIWLDSALTLHESQCRRIGRASKAEARIRQIINQYGVPLASARYLQLVLIQGTMLYAAKLIWSGQRGVEGGYQRAINRMAWSMLGAFRSTP